MSIVVHMLWPVFMACAVLGFGFGAVFGAGSGLPSATVAVRLGAVSACLGIGVLAWTGVVPGRPGLWLDIAAACIASYAMGAILAACGRWAIGRSSRTDRATDPQPGS